MKKIIKLGIVLFLSAAGLAACSMPWAKPVEPTVEPSAEVDQPPATVDLNQPRIQASDLAGGWAVEHGEFEEIIFDEHGGYSTYLHARPYDQGEWAIVDNQELELKSGADSSLNQHYQVISLVDNVLTIENQQAQSKWIRIENNKK